jgi:transcriptional regulator with GAF, ATPase, and Fis domain
MCENWKTYSIAGSCEAEAKALVDALKEVRGNVSAVARSMDLTPRAVHMKLKRLGIEAGAFRSRPGAPRRLTSGE